MHFVTPAFDDAYNELEQLLEVGDAAVSEQSDTNLLQDQLGCSLSRSCGACCGCRRDGCGNARTGRLSCCRRRDLAILKATLLVRFCHRVERGNRGRAFLHDQVCPERALKARSIVARGPTELAR